MSAPGSAQTTAPGLSLVIVIHDSASALAALLRSVGQLIDPPPQIVVVDNASRDHGAALARDAGAEVVALPDNVGFGAACNEGVRRARAPVTALVNPDVVLLDGGLLRLSRRLASRDVLLAPGLLNNDGSRQRSAHPLPGTVGALLPALIPSALLGSAVRRRAEPWRTNRPRTVGWAIAACLLARTATLARLGPFDPRMFLFFEDLDLCLRARASGVPTELHPDVLVVHSGAHSTRQRYAAEPHLEMAQQRRRVVARNLGRNALLLDDAAQVMTFTGRAWGRRLLGRPAERELAQLAAARRARRR